MNFMDKNISIGQVVTAVPKAAQIFHEFGIDYCCGGHRPLLEVIANQSINEAELFKCLNQAFADRQLEYEVHNNHFDEMSPAVLSTYIEDTHHSYLRRELPEIADLLSTIVRVHGRNHRELYDVSQLFGRLKTDLEQHLLKEETLLFPILDTTEDNVDEIKSLTSEIITEHEAAGKILRSLREVSGDYTLPEDACNTFKKAYSSLVELEQDLHQHIHLENNILLKSYSDR
jgi:regulator of cell morphogenesis and NO signaling